VNIVSLSLREPGVYVSMTKIVKLRIKKKRIGQITKDRVIHLIKDNNKILYKDMGLKLNILREILSVNKIRKK